MATFLEKIIENEGGRIRLVTAREQGKPAWYFIELFTDKYAEYKRAIASNSLRNISDYGTLRLSGWGTEPPTDMYDQFISRKKYQDTTAS